jgi:hypothetical protein
VNSLSSVHLHVDHTFCGKSCEDGSPYIMEFLPIAFLASTEELWARGAPRPGSSEEVRVRRVAGAAPAGLLLVSLLAPSSEGASSSLSGQVTDPIQMNSSYGDESPS